MKKKMKYTGKELIERGYRPGKWFREALEHINSTEMSEAEMQVYLNDRAPKVILPHDAPKDYHLNIDGDTEVELDNIKAVQNTMYQLMKTPTVIKGAVMPDACPTGAAGQIPVGGIAVAVDAIHPAMHSADICCSVMMTSYGMVEPKKVLNKANAVTHFGYGGRKDLFELSEHILKRMKNNRYLNDDKSLHLAHTHLGTQGDGNHFLYVGQSENTGETIMVTHHGSRGLGAYLLKR